MDDKLEKIDINNNILEEIETIDNEIRKRIDAIPCSAICKNGEPCKNKTCHPSGLCSLHRERTKLQKIASKNNGQKLKVMFEKLHNFKLKCSNCSLSAKLLDEDGTESDARICPMYSEDGYCTVITDIKDINEVMDTSNPNATKDILSYMLADQIVRMNTVIATTENIMGEIGNTKVLQQQEILMKMLKMYNDFTKETQQGNKKDSFKMEFEGDNILERMFGKSDK